MEIKTSIKIIIQTYIQVISNVKHFWFSEVDIRKEGFRMNHLYRVASQCVTRDRCSKTYEQQAAPADKL